MNSSSYDESDVGRFVLKRVHSFTKHSDLEQVRCPRQVAWSEVSASRPLIGKGAFSNVYQVTLSGDERVYALKRLNSTMPISTKKFKTGAADLVLEAKMLECLDHPNIIRQHGINQGDLADCINHRDFFLLLDFLASTLDNQLRQWERDNSGFLSKLNKVAIRKRLVQRLEHTALPVARAMEYLHSKNIIFRDLKPENVGYDCDNVVKLFDFGLARDLSCVRRSGVSMGFTGTPRYMANEIGEGKEYGLKVDVYSFGILLWQICTLKDPFADMFHISQYHQWIVREGLRPDLKLIKGSELQRLIAQCWDPSPDVRPTFSEICNSLQLFLRDHSSEPKKTNTRKSMLQLDDNTVKTTCADDKTLITLRTFAESKSATHSESFSSRSFSIQRKGFRAS